jgi:hypothetical protein
MPSLVVQLIAPVWLARRTGRWNGIAGRTGGGFGVNHPRASQIRHAITWGDNVLGDRAGTNRGRIRAHSVQNVGAGRVRTPHGLA